MWFTLKPRLFPRQAHSHALPSGQSNGIRTGEDGIASPIPAGLSSVVKRPSAAPVVFQINRRSFSDLLMKLISSASKLRQWQVWRTEICATKIRKFSRISEKSAASAKYLKNPRYRIVLINDLLQIGFSPALPSSSISASSFDLNNYRGTSQRPIE
jgi:hypothetical protein